MRSKVTVVLLFLNVVLFAYIFYFEWGHGNNLLVASHAVLPPEISSMDSFTRTARTGETVKIEKRGESWWLTKPYEWPANPNAATHIHNELQFLKDITSFAVSDLAKSGQTLADYGLADPALTLEFTAAQKSYKLLIGDNTKDENNLYVLSPDGARIHVVSRSLAESVSLPLSDLRNPTIFTVPVFEVRSLNLQLAAPSNLKVRLRRDAAAHWNFESPILARGAKTSVEVTISALNGLTARTFVEPHDADLDRTGLASPALRVTLEGNARRETLLLGNPAPTAGDYYAKIEDKSVVFTTTVPPQLLEVLRAAQENLRDPHVIDFEPATVTALTIAAPGQPELALQKLESAAPDKAAPAGTTAPESWQVVTRTAGQAPVTLAGDAAVISELLTKLQLLSARQTTLPNGQTRYGFLSDAPSAAEVERYGFNRAEREITFNLNTGGGLSGKDPQSVVLQVGVSPDEPGKAFARLTNPPFVYEILPDILDETPLRRPPLPPAPAARPARRRAHHQPRAGGSLDQQAHLHPEAQGRGQELGCGARRRARGRPADPQRHPRPAAQAARAEFRRRHLHARPCGNAAGAAPVALPPRLHHRVQRRCRAGHALQPAPHRAARRGQPVRRHGGFRRRHVQHHAGVDRRPVPAGLQPEKRSRSGAGGPDARPCRHSCRNSSCRSPEAVNCSGGL